MRNLRHDNMPSPFLGAQNKSVSPFRDSKKDRTPPPVNTTVSKAAVTITSAQTQFDYAMKLHARKRELMNILDQFVEKISSEIAVVESKYQDACKISRGLDEEINRMHIMGSTKFKTNEREVLIYDFSPDK